MNSREKNDFDDDDEDWGSLLHHRNRPQKKERGERREFLQRDSESGDSKKKRKGKRINTDQL
ncbi:MAG: hypothetical protein C0631_11935 [Sedimenticola sp.]|nr:MAG: hypothetical protein C0631_11935 [Sedimenticola sp.]